MRIFIVMLLAAMAFSGCLDDDPDTETETMDEPMDMPMETQEPLQYSGNMVSLADGGTGLIAACEFPGSCVSFDFTVDADNTNVTMVLASNDGAATGATGQVLYGTDYDLFLYASGGQIGSSTNPGEELDEIALNLDAGTYTAQVHSWNDVDGEFVLDITFN